MFILQQGQTEIFSTDAANLQHSSFAGLVGFRDQIEGPLELDNTRLIKSRCDDLRMEHQPCASVNTQQYGNTAAAAWTLKKNQVTHGTYISPSGSGQPCNIQ